MLGIKFAVFAVFLCLIGPSVSKIDWGEYIQPEDLGNDGSKLDALIEEDLNKVDFSNLPVEFEDIEVDEECEDRRYKVTGYRYITKNKAGDQVGIILTQKTTIHDTDGIALSGREGKPDEYITFHRNLNCHSQDDEILTNHIKEKMLIPPNGEDLKLANPIENNIEGEVGQPLDVDRIVFGGELKNGFFLEAGAFDGEYNSDSLYFEMNHGWTGLLVEPHPYAASEIKARNRNASIIQTCLSTDTKPQFVNFDLSASVRNATHRESMMGITLNPIDDNHVKMQCMPIYSILMAMGNPTVHHFSLDVEGAEFAILRTIPWDKVDIQSMSIESHLLNRIFPGTREELIKFLDEAGYNFIPWGHTASNENRMVWSTTDDLFVRKDIPLKMTKEEKEKLYSKENRSWPEKEGSEVNRKDPEYTYNREEYRQSKLNKKDEL